MVDEQLRLSIAPSPSILEFSRAAPPRACVHAAAVDQPRPFHGKRPSRAQSNGERSRRVEPKKAQRQNTSLVNLTIKVPVSCL